jgi:AcrR family transcriptional regulator
MNAPSVIQEAPSGKRGRGRPRVDDKRRRLLDAALAVFADRGFHGTAMPLVAEAAGVGMGTVYRYCASKELLVNEVFRDAKRRLQHAIVDGLVPRRDSAALFADLWARLVGFARAEPLAFRFLEMQDHVRYLDDASRALELEVLSPIWLAGSELTRRGVARDMPTAALIALVWGALVGLLKAERLGYLTLEPETLRRAGEACWAAVSRPAAAAAVHPPEATPSPANRPVLSAPRRRPRTK